MEKEDRNAVSSLHGLPQPSAAWGSKRHPIMPPTNRGTNPWSNRTATTLRGSHPNSNRTLTESTGFAQPQPQHRNAEHQAKRRRVEYPPTFPGMEPSKKNRIKGMDVLTAPEVQEDLGEVVVMSSSSSRDEIDMLPPNASTNPFHTPKAASSVESRHFKRPNSAAKSLSSSTSTPRASTSSETITIDDDDDIEEFPEEPVPLKRAGSRPPAGVVTNHVRALESRVKPPKLDLRVPPTRDKAKDLPLKSRMKGKEGAVTQSLGKTNFTSPSPRNIAKTEAEIVPLADVFANDRHLENPCALQWVSSGEGLRFNLRTGIPGEDIHFRAADMQDIELPRPSLPHEEDDHYVMMFKLSNRSQDPFLLLFHRRSSDAFSTLSRVIRKWTQPRLAHPKNLSEIWRRALEGAREQDEVQEITPSQAIPPQKAAAPKSRKNAAVSKSKKREESHSTEHAKTSPVPRTRSRQDVDPDIEITEPPPPSVRRSARQSDSNLKRKRTPSPPRLPPKDPEELILVYPPSGPGAINVHNHDLQRLDVGEFLNDTIIEFGLKLWHREVADRNPELAEQIHIFSPFFYKKLNKKNVEETYETVKRWTSKIDVFNKTYLVVPINENLHWYLAIIYQPSLIMEPPPTPPPKRTSGRKSGAQGTSSPLRDPNALQETHHMNEDGPSENTGSPSSTGAIVDEGVTPAMLGDLEAGSASAPETEDLACLPPLFLRTSSQQTMADLEESEVRGQLLPASDNVQRLSGPHSKSNSLSESFDNVHLEDSRTAPSTNTTSNSLSSDDVQMSSPLTIMDDEDEMEVDPALVRRISVSPTASDIPPQEHRSIEGVEAWNQEPSTSGPSDLTATGIEPDKFYGAQKQKARAKPKPKPALKTYGAQANGKGKEKAEEEILELDSDAEHAADTRERAYIFILDSLNGQHKRPITVLTKYLQLEAKERKGITAESVAVGKRAHVPNQQNFSDCGCYLLHFAHMFGTNPDGFVKLILSQPSKPTPSEKTSKDWDGEGAHAFRRQFRSRIESMSEKWKQEREAQRKLAESAGQASEVVDSSEDEVIIEERSPIKPTAKGRKAKDRHDSETVKSKAVRLR